MAFFKACTCHVDSAKDVRVVLGRFGCRTFGQNDGRTRSGRKTNTETRIDRELLKEQQSSRPSQTGQGEDVKLFKRCLVICTTVAGAYAFSFAPAEMSRLLKTSPMSIFCSLLKKKKMAKPVWKINLKPPFIRYVCSSDDLRPLFLWFFSDHSPRRCPLHHGLFFPAKLHPYAFLILS